MVFPQRFLRTGSLAARFLVAAALAALPASAQPRLVVDAPIVPLPESHQGEALETGFVLRNDGDSTLEISTVESGGHDVRHPQRIAPGESAPLTLVLDPEWHLGLLTARVRVHSNDPANPIQVLAARGFVLSSFLPESPVVPLGRVLAAEGGRGDLLVECVDQVTPTLEPEGELPDGMRIETRPEVGTRGGVRVAFVLEPGTPPGFLDHFVVFRTNSPNHARYRVRVSAEVVGEVGAHPSKLDVGPIQSGIPLTAAFEVRSDLASLEWSEPALPEGVRILSMTGCSTAPTCRRFEIEVERTVRGPWSDRIRFSFGPRHDLEIPVGGFVVKPGTQVTHLGTFEPKASDGEPSLPAFPLEAPTAAPPLPPREDPRWPRLRWRVDREDRIYGYSVMRATARTGPFTRVDDELIRRESAASGDYWWEDRSAEPGQTYYYFVDVVSVAGIRQPLTGVLARTTPP